MHGLYACCVMATRSWTWSLHQRIAGRIRDARRGRLSAQQLADATAALGYPITRSQIANYESGRKQSLEIAELLVLAAALGVPPLSLLFPEQPDRQVEMLPGVHTSTLNAMHRFVGDGGPLWPRHEVAALIDKLDQIGGAMTGRGELTVETG